MCDNVTDYGCFYLGSLWTGLLEMNDYLPVLLVSALDMTEAFKIINELLISENGEVEYEKNANGRILWNISNKYYKAKVEVKIREDSQALSLAPEADAHLIYIGAQECVEEAWVRRRLSRPCAVCLCACEGGDEWVRGGYEGVAMRSAGGVARLREALQAHQWRSMQIEDASNAEPAERWALAMDAFGAVLALPPQERREHAHRVISALCDALEDDEDDLQR